MFNILLIILGSKLISRLTQIFVVGKKAPELLATSSGYVGLGIALVVASTLELGILSFLRPLKQVQHPNRCRPCVQIFGIKICLGS
jgi:hypothetical protein